MLRAVALALLPVAALASKGYHKLPVSRSTAPSGTINSTLWFKNQWLNGQGGYFVDIGVGSPPQQIKVQLDTGSPSLWIPASSAAQCDGTYDCVGGAFNGSLSSTIRRVPGMPPYKATYIDQSGASGIWVNNVVTIGNATLTNHTFGLADEVNVAPWLEAGAQYGIMGINLRGTENCRSTICYKTYMHSQVPGALYESGQIASRSYSIYLDNIKEQKGSILFGGIDTAKFSGELVTLASPPHDFQIDYYGGMFEEQALMLTSIVTNANGTSNTTSLPDYSRSVLIDTGAASIELPQKVFESMRDSLPRDILAPFGTHRFMYTYCDQASYNFSLSFTLGDRAGRSATIEVPFREMLVPFYTGDYNSTTRLTDHTNDNREVCRINVAGSERPLLLLGDPLIRSAYVFHNLDEHTISIAQPSYYTKGESIVAVGQGPTPNLWGTGYDSIQGANVSVPAGAGDL